MTAAGISQEDAASVLDISDRTLRKHYRKELQSGYARVKERLATKLIAKADAGDVKCLIFYLETRGGWGREDRVTLANADGKPLNLTVTYRKPDVPAAG